MALLPTSVQAQEMVDANDLEMLFALVGIPTPPPEGQDDVLPRLFFRALGNPVTLSELALIPTEVYATTAAGLQPQATPLAQGRCVQAQKWARHALGLIPDTGCLGPGYALVPAPEAISTLAVVPPLGAPAPNLGTKTSSIADESMD